MKLFILVYVCVLPTVPFYNSANAAHYQESLNTVPKPSPLPQHFFFFFFILSSFLPTLFLIFYVYASQPNSRQPWLPCYLCLLFSPVFPIHSPISFSIYVPVTSKSLPMSWPFPLISLLQPLTLAKQQKIRII